MNRRYRSLFVWSVAAVLLAACSLSTGGDAAATASSGSSQPAAKAAGTTGKVSANTASRDELVVALTAAGVANADRWAAEVMEYRPYAADDPTVQKLQDNLAKYNPDPATLQAILAALEP